MSIEYRGKCKWRFRVNYEGQSYSNNYTSIKEPKLDNNGKAIILSDVEKAHNAFVVDVQRGNIGTNENMAFAEFTEIFLTDFIKEKRRGNTYITYNNRLKKHILPELGNMKLGKIRTIDIQKLINKLEKKFSARTIILDFGIMRHIFNKAIVWQIIVTNPCSGVEVPNMPSNAVRELLPYDEFLRLVDCIMNAKNQVFKVICLLALFGGLREGEVSAIQKNLITFSENKIEIDKQITKTFDENKNIVVDIAPPKTDNSYRVVYFPSFVMEELKKYIGSVIIPISQFIFWDDERKKPISPNSIQVRFDYFAKKNNFNISFHKLRHLNATMLLKEGADIADVASSLGDTIKTVSDVYIHDIQEKRKRNAQALNKFAPNLPDKENASS